MRRTLLATLALVLVAAAPASAGAARCPAAPRVVLDRGQEGGLRSRVVERMALCWQGALLVQHAPAPVADAFCAGRLDPGAAGLALGTLPAGVDAGAIIERAMPVAA